MPELLKTEVRRAFGNPLFALALGVGIVLALASAIENYLDYLDYIGQTSASRWANDYALCLWTMWLPMNINKGFASVFFFIAPLLAVLAWSWSDVADQRSGWAATIEARATRGARLSAKAGATFLAGGTVAAAPLLVNLVALACLVPAWRPDINDMLVTGIWERCFASQVFFTNPALYVVLRTGLNFVLAGTWACAVLGLSRLTRGRVVALGMPYVALVAVKFATDRLMVITASRWGAFTILDQLIMRGSAFYYQGSAVAIDLLVMAALAVVPVLLTKERDQI